MRILACMVFSLIVTGCAKDHKCDCVMPYEIYYLKARVAQTSDISCGRPILDFSEDSVRIKMITNRNDLGYVVANFPESLRIADKKLYVSVALLKPEDAFICTTLGPSFPAVKILDAKSRD